MNKAQSKKTDSLSMALTAGDRALLDKAARILKLPISVWGRAILLKEATKIISEATATARGA